MAVDGYSVPKNITSNAPEIRNATANDYVAESYKHSANHNTQPTKVLSWHIPRPSLISSHESSLYTSIGGASIDGYNIRTPPIYGVKGPHRHQENRVPRGSTSTQGSSSSNNSTQSARSGSLLLTVANLAKIDQEQIKTTKSNNQHNINLQYYLEQQNQDSSGHPTGVSNTRPTKEVDSLSIASSTHFTVVNGLDRHRNKISQNNSCCRKHKLTVLTLTMSSIFMFGIIVAVYLFEMRAMHLRNS